MKDETKIKQSLLEKIFELKNISASKLSDLLKLNIEICYSYCEEIHFDGYIDFIDASSADGKDALVKINGKGEVFLKNGGYIQEREDQIKEYNEISKNQKISNFAKYIIIITSILSIILASFTIIQNRKINTLEEFINSSQIKIPNNIIIGKWINLYSIDTSYYIFNANNTWKYMQLSKGLKTIVEGKYCINNNREILLIKTSNQKSGNIKIPHETNYLIYSDSLLIDNHSENIKTYKKTED